MKFLGSGVVKIDSMLLKTVPDSIEVVQGGVERTPIAADGGIEYHEKVVPGSLTCAFLHTANFPFDAVNNLSGGVIEVILDIGQAIILRNASRTGAPLTTGTGDGHIKASFSSGPPLQFERRDS